MLKLVLFPGLSHKLTIWPLCLHSSRIIPPKGQGSLLLQQKHQRILWISLHLWAVRRLQCCHLRSCFCIPAGSEKSVCQTLRSRKAKAGINNTRRRGAKKLYFRQGYAHCTSEHHFVWVGTAHNGFFVWVALKLTELSEKLARCTAHSFRFSLSALHVYRNKNNITVLLKNKKNAICFLLISSIVIFFYIKWSIFEKHNFQILN